MKLIFILLLLMLGSLGTLSAQESTQKLKLYNVWASVDGKKDPIKGVLFESRDSSIVLSRSKDKKFYRPIISNPDAPEHYRMNILPVNSIMDIKLRRVNNAAFGALIGALSGLLIGVISGLAAGDDPPCTQTWWCYSLSAEEKALYRGIPLTIVGAGLGAAFGSVKIKIPINKSQKNYNKAKLRLGEYAIRKK